MATQNTDVLARLERFADALPRGHARPERFGGLVLFVRESAGWPYYARPAHDAPPPSIADIGEARERQRELGLPEAFEWIHEVNPDLLAVARAANLDVVLAPLLVLEPGSLPPAGSGGRIRLLDPGVSSFAADLGTSRAVARLGFGMPAPATPVEAATGALITEPAGPRERDAVPGPSAEAIEVARDDARRGAVVTAVAEDADGIVSSGIYQRAGDVAEIAGVATLPSARRRGHATRLTAALARHAVAQGCDLVFLSAADEDVARMYARVGFRRVGTAGIAGPAIAEVPSV